LAITFSKQTGINLVSGVNLRNGMVEEFAKKLSEKVENMRTITHAFYFGKID